MFRGTHSQEECCSKCGLYSEQTNIVTNGGTNCYCQTADDPSTATVDSLNFNGWTAGTCLLDSNTTGTGSGRKKRQSSDSGAGGDVGGTRAKRSVNLEKERRVSCVASGNSSASWTYDYEVPRMCYSRLTDCLLFY